MLNVRANNLGVLREASFTTNKLTVVCGANNTGKTYITYALYGFLKKWRSLLSPILRRDKLLGRINRRDRTLDLSYIADNLDALLTSLSSEYNKWLPQVLAAEEVNLRHSSFSVSTMVRPDISRQPYTRVLSSSRNSRIVATISKDPESYELGIITPDADGTSYPLHTFIYEAIADIAFAPLFPNVFISSTERSGAAIFMAELDFARTKLLKLASTRKRDSTFQRDIEDALTSLGRTDY